ncbi:SGNH/GDSL hydrolase family protein [Alteraurantiacibacter aquimixticola]|uniref:SGNH/GDSL hydrolase family protein n=1 Tax=Alteraurantiacibacter aquimixticola TaxID=2489173 RepID=A0A4T3F616_9SPHN|nr:SGNH/GDSL hydrolase family protein [Alteraurantiacibacter aquimixticola]TIX51844.1 SGNH/GDSL hydrolase family protein [Alteraurantiacibacter aquimixticola]
MTRGLRMTLLAVPLTLALGVLVLGSWAIAPYPASETIAIRTAKELAQVPFADRLVIGDSRVHDLSSGSGTLFIGYDGATIQQMERLARTACALHDAPTTIALGINDAMMHVDTVEDSIASMESIVRACQPSEVKLAQIWPAESGVEPLGDAYDLDVIARLDAALAAIAEREGLKLLPVPPLNEGYTTDGAHFTPEYNALYAETLVDIGGE